MFIIVLTSNEISSWGIQKVLTIARSFTYITFTHTSRPTVENTRFRADEMVFQLSTFVVLCRGPRFSSQSPHAG